MSKISFSELLCAMVAIVTNKVLYIIVISKLLKEDPFYQDDIKSEGNSPTPGG